LSKNPVKLINKDLSITRVATNPAFAIIKDIVQQHLKTALIDIKQFSITSSTLEKCNGEETWHLNVEYILQDDKEDNIRRVALFSVKGNEVIRFEQGKCWKP
jgi:hypothetical protein